MARETQEGGGKTERGGGRDRGRKWWSVEEADLTVLADEELSRLSECGGGKVRE